MHNDRISCHNSYIFQNPSAFVMGLSPVETTLVCYDMLD